MSTLLSSRSRSVSPSEQLHHGHSEANQENDSCMLDSTQASDAHMLGSPMMDVLRTETDARFEVSSSPAVRFKVIVPIDHCTDGAYESESMLHVHVLDSPATYTTHAPRVYHRSNYNGSFLAIDASDAEETPSTPQTIQSQSSGVLHHNTSATTEGLATESVSTPRSSAPAHTTTSPPQICDSDSDHGQMCLGQGAADASELAVDNAVLQSQVHTPSRRAPMQDTDSHEIYATKSSPAHRQTSHIHGTDRQSLLQDTSPKNFATHHVANDDSDCDQTDNNTNANKQAATERPVQHVHMEPLELVASMTQNTHIHVRGGDTHNVSTDCGSPDSVPSASSSPPHGGGVDGAHVHDSTYHHDHEHLQQHHGVVRSDGDDYGVEGTPLSAPDSVCLQDLVADNCGDIDLKRPKNAAHHVLSLNVGNTASVSPKVACVYTCLCVCVCIILHANMSGVNCECQPQGGLCVYLLICVCACVCVCVHTFIFKHVRRILRVSASRRLVYILVCV
jgi:hypothetical protein